MDLQEFKKSANTEKFSNGCLGNKANSFVGQGVMNSKWKRSGGKRGATEREREIKRERERDREREREGGSREREL